jgi:hypothetical protein
MKIALICVTLLSLTACGTRYNIPAGKTQQNFYNDYEDVTEILRIVMNIIDAHWWKI